MILSLSLFFIALSLGLTALFCRLAHNSLLMGKPLAHSMHSVPTIRGGGLVFIVVSLLGLMPIARYLGLSFSAQAPLWLGIGLVGLVSFIDDLFQLGVRPRLLTQALVALCVALSLQGSLLDFGFFSLHHKALIIPLVFFLVIAAINHFNFMDGMDGLCALQALFLLASYALLQGFPTSLLSDYLGYLLMLSLIAFLWFNWPPARLFMGDVGSATLGFIVLAEALIAQQRGLPLLYWFLLNGLFIFDSGMTLLRRIWRKEKWSLPHKQHAYQRLRQANYSVQVILFCQGLLNICFLLLVLCLQHELLPLSLVVLLQWGGMGLGYYWIETKSPIVKSLYVSP